tara:strand:- start:4404 stop:5717 length:1314 start_codon:yes stop_codon:yes gene_type:complete
MAYTLQRKMFKLGGSVAHGGGITANLKNPNRKPMKKGGRVETETTPVGVGSGNQPMVPGPDGKMREAHLLPVFLGGAGMAGIGSVLGRLLLPQALRALGQGARQGSLNPLKQFINRKVLRDSGIKGSDAALKKGKGFTMLDEVVPSALTKIGRGAQLAAPVGILGGATGAGLGLGMAGAERAGLIERGNDDSFGEEAARTIGKIGLDFSVPGVAKRVSGLLTGTEQNPTRSSLYDTIAGAPVGAANVPQSATGKVATKQISEMEKLKNAALERKGLYESLMYQPDKLALASNALLAAGTSALRGDELADVVESGFAPINKESARKREISNASSQQAITDILNDKANRQKMLAKIAESGDPRAIARVKKFFDASDQGVDDVLPLDAKGAMDTAGMMAGSIYADIDNSTGKLFVAVNKSGTAIKQFDTVEEAIEHSQTA